MKEYEIGGTGPGSVREIIEKSVGKTIARIQFGPVPSTARDEHDGEKLIFHFADGSALELGNGSNAAQLSNGVRASEVSLSFIAALHKER